jgi:hypothetical protein
MSKRYVIQVNSGTEWVPVLHPDTQKPWMTRTRNTALMDAARMINHGETRELRVVISRPVYEILVEGGATPEELVTLAQITADTKAEIEKYGYGDPGDTDYVAPTTDDDDTPQFEIVNEN